jgi:hypothetical protein
MEEIESNLSQSARKCKGFRMDLQTSYLLIGFMSEVSVCHFLSHLHPQGEGRFALSLPLEVEDAPQA